MPISRREFCEWFAEAGMLAAAPVPFAPVDLPTPRQSPASAARSGSDIGTLYPFIQKQADRSGLELSFLRPEFRDLRTWQRTARARVMERLSYRPGRVAAAPQVLRRQDKGDYIEEYLTFQTTPDIRVPAYVLVPKNAKFPAPGLVVLHCHGGFYLWGKEKVVAIDAEPPTLTTFKQQLYEGKSIATELVRRGYVVISIDMLYWGERRMLLDGDPAAYRDPASMSADEVAGFNRRSADAEQLVARSLFTAGITWPGVMVWDDLRSVDYLAARPEVDARRLGCVGLSVGGYRSFVLAALDSRIKVAVDVGWMSSLASHIKQHIVHTIGFTFHIVGLSRDLDFPDLAALIAPRSVLVINGSQDQLFPPEGVDAAFKKIERCYGKAGVPDRQRCRLYDAPHQFNVEMQSEAWDWIARWI